MSKRAELRRAMRKDLRHSGMERKHKRNFPYWWARGGLPKETS